MNRSITFNSNTTDTEWEYISKKLIRYTIQYFSNIDIEKEESAHDISMDIFIKLYQKFQKSNETIDNIDAYLITVVRNEHKNWMAKKENKIIKKGNVSELKSDELYQNQLFIDEIEIKNEKISLLSLLHETTQIGYQFKKYVNNDSIYDALKVEFLENGDSNKKDPNHAQYKKRGIIFLKRFIIEEHLYLLADFGNLNKVFEILKNPIFLEPSSYQFTKEDIIIFEEYIFRKRDKPPLTTNTINAISNAIFNEVNFY